MSHTCHWPGCEVEVLPALWGCRRHWFALPKQLRNQIWKTYRAGQEVDKRPSAEYLVAAEEAQIWAMQSITYAREREMRALNRSLANE